jgi:predicted nucleic acid-binding protein
MKLLDTTVIIGILRGDAKLKDVIEKIKDEELAITVLTYFELFQEFTVETSKKKKKY